MALPMFMVLKANFTQKYLHYLNEDGNMHGFLRFTGDEVVSPYAKYELEMAKCGKGLVNIRCCYNNKYWVRIIPKENENDWWIVARADEPMEDQSERSCTLFEPTINVDGPQAQTVRLRHVQSGEYACLWRFSDYTHDYCLGLAKDMPWEYMSHEIIDWESLLILPKHVAFKADNGKYLSACYIEGYPYLQFACSDIGDPTVVNEVFTTADGNIRIKSDYLGKFWRRGPNSSSGDNQTTGPNWIWADSDDTTSKDSNTLFWPVKLGDNVIALCNLGNNNFCKRLTTVDHRTNCLNADVSTISQFAYLEVEELVISRNIYNVNFRLDDARIYNQTVVTMTTGEAVNRTDVSNTVDVKLSYTETRSSTWNYSVSLKGGVKTTFVTKIPFIAEGKIEVSAELSGAKQWGETESSTTQVETVYKVSVPPMSNVKESLLATKGTCDVPFSYTQRDTLSNGQQIAYRKDDGVYTGINCYNFKYEATQEKL